MIICLSSQGNFAKRKSGYGIQVFKAASNITPLRPPTEQLPQVLSAPLHKCRTENIPYPDSSCLNTSITGLLSRLLMRQTPPSVIVALSPASCQLVSHAQLPVPQAFQKRKAQQKKGPEKLTFQKPRRKPNTNIPIPAPLPLFFTMPGIALVSSSSSLSSIPSFDRKPTMILGTPRRKGLDPEFEQFALVFLHVAVGLRRCGCFQLDPVYG